MTGENRGENVKKIIFKEIDYQSLGIAKGRNGVKATGKTCRGQRASIGSRMIAAVVSVVAVAAPALLWRSRTMSGHLQPLGHQHPPHTDPIPTLDYFPPPWTFFEEYVLPERPVLLKGQAELQPAFHRWTDDYLRSQFGSIKVEAEKQKKENRKLRIREMTMSQFLDRYATDSIYMVTDLEEVAFRADLLLPPCLRCGGFQDALFTNILWFSSGGTSSVLHTDDVDNIHCLLEGTKIFFLADKKDKHLVNFDGNEGFSLVDVDRVDLNKYPELQNLKWHNLTMEKGDCLFIPRLWPHQVRSYGSRNLAINFWFTRIYNFDNSSCDKGDENGVSMNTVLINNDGPRYARLAMLSMTEGKTPLSLQDFLEIFGEFMTADEGKDMFGKLDLDGDGILHLADLYSMDVMDFHDIFSEAAENMPRSLE